MSAKTDHVPGGLTPASATLCRVISAVFIVVQKPRPRSIARRTYPDAHRRVGLRDTAAHATEQARRAGRDASVDAEGLDLGRGEQQDGALGARLDPGPALSVRAVEQAPHQGIRPW